MLCQHYYNLHSFFHAAWYHKMRGVTRERWGWVSLFSVTAVWHFYYTNTCNKQDTHECECVCSLRNMPLRVHFLSLSHTLPLSACTCAVLFLLEPSHPSTVKRQIHFASVSFGLCQKQQMHQQKQQQWQHCGRGIAHLTRCNCLTAKLLCK